MSSADAHLARVWDGMSIAQGSWAKCSSPTVGRDSHEAADVGLVPQQRSQFSVNSLQD